jgi:hypothetical protein
MAARLVRFHTAKLVLVSRMKVYTQVQIGPVSAVVHFLDQKLLAVHGARAAINLVYAGAQPLEVRRHLAIDQRRDGTAGFDEYLG